MAAALSREDFEAICNLVCPHCRAGDPVRKRRTTGEWVHNAVRTAPRGQQITTGICWAHGLRVSDYAPAPEPGDPEPLEAV